MSSCTVPGVGSGLCVDTSGCGGRSYPGYCPGAANIQCCVSACNVSGSAGTCIDKSACRGTATAGYCPGAANIQCCTGSSGGSSSTSSSSSSSGTSGDYRVKSTGETSQNGWPASQSSSAINLSGNKIVVRSGKSWYANTRAEVEPLLSAMVRWWDENVEPVTQYGSYNYRPIRGSTTTLSNHSSGTAIDINWDKHPLGAVGTVSSSAAAGIRAKARELGLRWGGDYRSRKDEMHFEVMAKPLLY